MTRKAVIAAASVVLLLGNVSRLSAEKMPILMDKYNEFSLSRAEYRDKCTICHVRDDGSGPLTNFGNKYDRVNLQFTEALVGEYPNLFRIEGAASVESPSGDGGKGAVVSVPGNELFNVKKYFRQECKNCHGKYGDGDPFQGVTAWATKKWLNERAPQYDVLLDIILNGKDKMIGHAGKVTESEA